MRTTIRLDDELLKEAKRQAAESGTTLTAIIEQSLRERLYRRESKRRPSPVCLKTAGSGGLRDGVDLDDSASLLGLMEGEE